MHLKQITDCGSFVRTMNGCSQFFHQVLQVLGIQAAGSLGMLQVAMRQQPGLLLPCSNLPKLPDTRAGP